MNDETGAVDKEAGFRKASTFTSALKVRGSQDFSFMKRKVRVNVIESEVQEYHLEQDEIDAKKRKGKRY